MWKSRRSIVIFDACSWEITLRELIFSFLIVGVMAVVGYLISDAIKRSVHNNQLKYKQAIQIDNRPEQFAWAIDTDVGNAFANGPLKTIDPVKHEKLNGSWMKLVAKHQKYQMHTRVVTYTTTVNGKPRTRTRTETYWSWDTFKREIKTATTVSFLGVDIPYRKFSFIDSSDKRFTVSTGHNRRIVFVCTPTEMSGTIFTTIANKQISDNTPFYVSWNIDRTYKHYTNSCSVMIFWICWIALIIGILSIYFVAENNWLED